MKKKLFLLILPICLYAISSYAQERQFATLELRDGRKISGYVTLMSPAKHGYTTTFYCVDNAGGTYYIRKKEVVNIISGVASAKNRPVNNEANDDDEKMTSKEEMEVKKALEKTE